MNSTKIKFFSFGLLVGITIGFLLFTLMSKNKIASISAQPDTIANLNEQTEVGLNGKFPPPKYAKDAPMVFESQPPAEVKIAWVKAAEVPKVRVRIFDGEGKLIHTNSFSGTFGYVKNMPWKGGNAPFATYRLELVSLNKSGEEGPPSESRALKVYRNHFTTKKSNGTINLTSPEIKSIHLEDTDN